MFKRVHDTVWVFDLEWVPDPETGRRLLRLGAEISNEQVISRMWAHAGATDEEPRPYLKTALCRIVSVAALVRRRVPDEKGRPGPASLSIFSLPAPGEFAMPERDLISRFLDGAGKQEPQLVGFNVSGADLPILLQRGMAQGLAAPDFCKRPDKPWDGRDYFNRSEGWCVDLKDVLGGWGKAAPSLHELAAAAGIPGKLDFDGSHVVDLWVAGRHDDIVAYNECDALTTYLVWLRTAHLGGFVSTAEREEEEMRLEELLGTEADSGRPHLGRYLEEWRRCRRR